MFTSSTNEIYLSIPPITRSDLNNHLWPKIFLICLPKPRLHAKLPTMIEDRGVVAGNVVDKYRSHNPIMRLLMNNFLRTVSNLYLELPVHTVLEIGCGEGDLIAHLQKLRPADFVGTDFSPRILEMAQKRYPDFHFQAQSAVSLAFTDASFDLVVACEVLEHLPDPKAALCEIARVTRQYAILSVPHEPIWRVLNMARFAYLKDFGNTPGHLQHWNAEGFVRFVSSAMRVRKILSPFPWTMLVAEVT
ncbi:MAG: class I SAM-dependent methyltransferase [Pseudomonadota bacterium]